MKKRAVNMQSEASLFVDLTIHDISAFLITEFLEKIVRPYYSANTSKALKDLILSAIREEDFILDHIKETKRGDHG